MSKIKDICKTGVSKDLKDYFDVLFRVYKALNKANKIITNNLLDTSTLEELKDLNVQIYKELVNDNPLFMDNSDKLHTYMSIILYNLNDFGYTIYSKKDYKKFKSFKKFLEEVLPLIKSKDGDEVEKSYLSYIKDYKKEEKVNSYVRSLYINETSFENFFINSCNLDTYDYLYKYGKYVSDTQLKIVDYLNSVGESKITDMAKTMIDGFLRGAKAQNIDISKKEFVVLHYPLGFEKVALEAQNYIFKISGLKALLKVTDISPNRQVDYSHRNNSLLLLSEDCIDNKIGLYQRFFRENSEKISTCAGRLYIETFGEKQFVPKKIDIVEATEELNKLERDYNNSFRKLYYKFTKSEETSFCIISYPSPEIDEYNFEEIFNETIKLNTLDNYKWQQIQQKIIDTLDEGSKVRVIGKNNNNTDIIVNLHTLRENQTNFENCTADVNIPVGEVFTSPVLKGTNGILHVSKVFLRGLEYKNLSFTFKDGKVIDYNCSNFDNEKDNKDFIKENILSNYENLPIGEFAIGTNTVAYVMARKYNIEDKLDILIAEKTGPHFALGDTCYSRQEDIKIYNPDGKEIIAKENEVSSKRHNENFSYFGCHTDVTIPYNEIKSISSIRDDGTEIPIIMNGKFVLEGTEELNVKGL